MDFQWLNLIQRIQLLSVKMSFMLMASVMMEANTSASEFPLLLDVYEPDNNCSNRPVFMWIHGGGFTGGIKHNPEIVEIANYYASRGRVFISIDYRTTEELGNVQGMTEDQVFTYYKGIAPQEWIDTLINNAPTSGDFYKGIAMYTAQRDAKLHFVGL